MIRSSFFGLNLGYKGVAAQQRALDVTGHNIANANTKGFSRQRAVMVTGLPMYTPNGYIGSGVEIINVERVRDKFLDQQFRNESNNKGYWDITYNTYSKIEDILNEPIDGSLRKSMDEFWASWQELSKEPESIAIRTTVLQKGITAAESFNHLSAQLNLLKKDIGYNLENKVSDINSLARRIADLNLQIIRSESDGRMANDFRDKRDLMVEELSKIVNLDISEDNKGALNIFVGGRALVYTTNVNMIQTVPRADGLFDVQWSNGSGFQVKNGELKALFDARDITINKYTTQIDQAAKAFAELTNAFHESGFGLGGSMDTGTSFFVIKGETVGTQAKGSGDSLWNGVAPIITSQTKTEELNGLNIIFVNDPFALNIATSYDDPALPGTLTITADWGSSNYSEEELRNIINGVLSAEGFETSIFLNMRGVSSADIVNTTISISGGTLPSAVFTGSNITVNQDLFVDLSKIAAAKAPVDDPENGLGDGGNALKIAQIKYNNNVVGGFSIDDYYRSMIGDIGINTQKAESMAANQELLVNQIATQREYVMGVSLDEEMTNMIQFQQAYNSAARFLTTVDEMLDVLVNRLGRVGL